MWRPDLEDLVSTRWPELTLRRYVVLALIAIGLLSVAMLGWGQERPAIDCRELAISLQVAAWARDMAADENRVAIFFRMGYREQLGERLSRAVEREVRRVWHDKLPAAEAVAAGHKRCLDLLGELGDG